MNGDIVGDEVPAYRLRLVRVACLFVAAHKHPPVTLSMPNFQAGRNRIATASFTEQTAIEATDTLMKIRRANCAFPTLWLPTNRERCLAITAC